MIGPNQTSGGTWCRVRTREIVRVGTRSPQRDARDRGNTFSGLHTDRIDRHAGRVHDLRGQRLVTPIVSMSGQDARAAVKALKPLYSGDDWYCRPVDEQFWFKYVAVGDDHLSFRRLQLHGYLSGTASTGEDIVVQWLERGRGRVKVGGTDAQVLPGPVPTLWPEARRFFIEYENWDQRLVHIGKDFLLAVIAEDGKGADGLLTFDTSVKPGANAISLWHQALRHAVNAYRSAGSDSASWHAARRDVARALLQLYPLRDDSPAPSVKAAVNRVAAALFYLRAHAHEPITVVDVAGAAGLSVRGLQEAFQREVKQSPLEYLRGVRLELVRGELQAAEPGDAVVAAVARQWGFSHLGRFAATYFARYGEYPRDTLRLSRL